MGVSYVYKSFSPQDKALVPFNAHKQYNLDSSSASTNKIDYLSSQHTSESISLYSSASSTYGSDTKNITKYNQIDHLFYRDHLKKVNSKKDFIHYLKQRKDLYEKSNILSIPSGLYGYEIRKGTFYLSSSIYEITDDSYGNLMISGTNINNYPNDVHQNVFKLDPIKSFKKYDLNIYDGYAIVSGYPNQSGQLQITEKKFWRNGIKNPTTSTTYTTTTKYPLGYYPEDEDDSYFFNKLNYNNVTFRTSSLGENTHKFPSINLSSSVESFIKTPHNKRFNFNSNEDYSISFYITPKSTESINGNISSDEKRYIIAKSGTKRVNNSLSSSAAIPEPQFPFEIYLQSQSLYFQRSDGNETQVINGLITASSGTQTCKKTSHILCQITSSQMELYFDGNKIASSTLSLKGSTRNKAHLYIGSKGNISTSDSSSSPIKYFNGELSNINIWSRAFTENQITNISESINASPYIGNIFYQSGFATITHPKYHTIVRRGNIGTMGIEEGFTVSEGFTSGINTLQFQGTHLIYENEYKCTVQEHEFNSTLNSSVRKNLSSNPYELEDFTTGSFFKPYVTTIGLYNEAHELLLIGKLGQPIRMSDETDTTFVVRWDT